MRSSLAFSLLVLCTIFLKKSCGKPAENLRELRQVIPLPASDLPNTEVVRQQRSPQFGLVDDNDYDYSSEEEDYAESRHFSGHKRKFHKHKPLGLHGGYGGWRPEHGGYHNEGHGNSHSGSFATASAGSSGGGHNGGHSEANSQSASFSFGPYTASFSVAHASSGRNDHY